MNYNNKTKALNEMGGIYFDTDIEVTKDISHITKNEVFLGVEDSGKVNAAVLGAKRPHEKFIDDMIAVYDSLEKFDIDNIYTITIPALITKELEKYGFDENKKEISIKL